MAAKTKKERSEAAKKAARTRKRNKAKAAKRGITEEGIAPLAFTGADETGRPLRRTGEAELFRRGDPKVNQAIPGR